MCMHLLNVLNCMSWAGSLRMSLPFTKVCSFFIGAAALATVRTNTCNALVNVIPKSWERMGNPGNSDERHFYTPGDADLSLLSNMTFRNSDVEFCNKIGLFEVKEFDIMPWSILEILILFLYRNPQGLLIPTPLGRHTDWGIVTIYLTHHTCNSKSSHINNDTNTQRKACMTKPNKLAGQERFPFYKSPNVYAVGHSTWQWQ